METLKTKLDNINPDLIDFDPHNPRGESQETIVNDESFGSLVDSIKQYGILEPIIIKENPENKNRYVLVDGERRLRAAKNIKAPVIPALLINKELDGKILAYHVHMLRKQWGKAAETKSIKRIINEIEKDTPNLSENEIKKKIKEITKTSQSRINDLYILIKYEDKYIDLVTEDKLDISYLIQGQTSFINRMISKYPEILNEFSENRLRTIIAEKSYRKLIPGTRFWMDTFRDVFNYEKEKESIKMLLIEFIDNIEISAEETFNKFKDLIKQDLNNNNDSIDSSSLSTKSSQNNIKKDNKGKSSQTPKSKQNNVAKSQQSSLDYSPITLTKKQQTSINDIRPKFDRIGKTFTDEEKEYIAEAIHCLELQCFKASVLMIWATGISRILNFVSKDLIDFNNCSQTMKSNNSSFYKHHSSNFQINATSIDEIRHVSKDIQLLCYLTFKTIINESQFKKLKAGYDTRNDCAHPTDIILKVNETIAIFENVLDFVISNPKLK